MGSLISPKTSIRQSLYIAHQNSIENFPVKNLTPLQLKMKLETNFNFYFCKNFILESQTIMKSPRKAEFAPFEILPYTTDICS